MWLLFHTNILIFTSWLLQEPFSIASSCYKGSDCFKSHLDLMIFNCLISWKVQPTAVINAGILCRLLLKLSHRSITATHIADEFLSQFDVAWWPHCHDVHWKPDTIKGFSQERSGVCYLVALAIKCETQSIRKCIVLDGILSTLLSVFLFLLFVVVYWLIKSASKVNYMVSIMCVLKLLLQHCVHT